MTTSTDPATPDLAGSSTSRVNASAVSSMPADCITERVFLTLSVLSSCWPVIGQTTPLASVAATTDSLRAVLSMLQDEK